MKKSFCKMQFVFGLLLVVVVGATLGLMCTAKVDCCAKGLILNIIGALITVFIAYPQPNNESVGGIVVEDGTPMGNGMTAGEMRKLCARNGRWGKYCSLLGIGCLVLGFVFQLYYQLTTT